MSEAGGQDDPRIARRGLLLVLSSPSGAGKTTLAHRLLAADASLHMSVSVTTRKARPGEVHGRDYTFIDQDEFEQLKNAGELLEWAEVYGRLYGTPKTPVLGALDVGGDVLFDIDWQGAQQLKQRLPEDVVSIFVLPPHSKALEQRLKTRAQDSDDIVAERMASAADQIAHWPEYDYVLINADLEASLASLTAILAAERLKRERQTGLPDFVRQLLASL